MRNIKLILSYDGADFSGWQTQLGVRTVQSTLQEAIRQLTGADKVHANASGRTDSGVHAVGQVVNFFTDSKLAPDVIMRGLNAHLPADVVISRVRGKWGRHSTHLNRDALRTSCTWLCT